MFVSCLEAAPLETVGGDAGPFSAWPVEAKQDVKAVNGLVSSRFIADKASHRAPIELMASRFHDALSVRRHPQRRNDQRDGIALECERLTERHRRIEERRDDSVG